MIALGLSHDLNQCNLRAYNFDRGVFLPGSNVARVSAPILSSCRVALKLRNLSLLKPSPSLTEVDTSKGTMAAQRAIGSAVYYDSMVEVAIEVCNFEHQTTKHPITSMMYPVWDLTDSGFLVPYLVPQPQAKAMSTKTSMENVVL